MLNEQTIAIIRDAQAKGIQAKQLVAEQLEIIYENNWFNIWVPEKYNGLELSLLDGFNLIKELSYWDGGLAWTVTLCSGANMFCGFINPQIAKSVFDDPKVCFGGSGRANGKAIWDGKKYYLTGTWQYATGAPHLTHFTLNTFIYDGPIQRLNEVGEPKMFSFFVPKQHVLIHYDWDTFGLECTASHSFSLENISVEPSYAFELKPSEKKVDSELYNIPFMTFAELTLLPNYLGMYKRFLDLSEKYFFEKSKNLEWSKKYSKSRFHQIDNLQQQSQNYEQKAKNLIQLLWEQVSADEHTISEELLSEITSESRRIVSEIRASVTTIFPLVGISGAQRDNELNIVFRNIFTATQHSLLNIEA
ncbi:acyl-CoA dehydrogenase family protein [Sphingobacterium bovistauri]|uniref:Acyl-CoA dehydrogenase n=1 Tax=Sphingobacterium bovistauri TaxID=2781959 RepID=A0ABS7Z016_9SPHI|nr:acyl-CoA dehydrogenase [Sphingobacterium bovistauri]MCA5003530.1 acyl-CoA dehydrogenase [Sphingobacterium bovistauri]